MKASIAAIVVVGMGLFSTLAAIRTRQAQAQAQTRVVTPKDQLLRLENYLGYPFWDMSANKAQPPTYVSSAPQTSSGGS